LFVLNPHSGTPIYRQIVEQVRRMVASGQLGAGAELPSVRELAIEHAVNPMTVSKAYSLLEAEGVLARQRGKPMTVAETSGTAPRARRAQQLDAQIEQLVLAARQLELSREDLLKAIRKNWSEDDE
jgi:GntR family transcriptional regulator